MNDLMEWLANFAFDHNIGYILTHMLNKKTPSTSYGDQRLIIINMEWYEHDEIPFSFAHEIGHILNGDKGINKYSAKTVSTKEEYKANLTAIQLLINYCHKNDIEINNPIVFCERFGIPINLEYIVSLKLRNIM